MVSKPFVKKQNPKKRKWKVVMGCGLCGEGFNPKQWKGDLFKGLFICPKCMKIINQAKKTGKVGPSKRVKLLVRKGILKRKVSD